jgi:uncharacterized protein (TIGR00255 family)
LPIIKSMTGFGAADGQVGHAHVSVEVRTVNHRFFNPSIKLPSRFARWEADVRDILRKRVSRGHVALTVRSRVDTPAGTAGIDEARFASYVATLAGLKQRYALGGELDVATVLRLPDVIVSETDETTTDADGAQLVAVVEEAVAALSAMRQAEGTRLAALLEERLAIVESAVARLAARAPDRLIQARDRLREAVRILTEGMLVDEQRIAQEIALLADRLDVSEELDRFRSHIDAFRVALTQGASDGVGKRLGFLIQEMLREANTTGSKANDAGMLQDVVLIKEELERIREQVDNIE